MESLKENSKKEIIIKKRNIKKVHQDNIHLTIIKIQEPK